MTEVERQAIVEEAANAAVSAMWDIIVAHLASIILELEAGHEGLAIRVAARIERLRGHDQEWLQRAAVAAAGAIRTSNAEQAKRRPAARLRIVD